MFNAFCHSIEIRHRKRSQSSHLLSIYIFITSGSYIFHIFLNIAKSCAELQWRYYIWRNPLTMICHASIFSIAMPPASCRRCRQGYFGTRFSRVIVIIWPQQLLLPHLAISPSHLTFPSHPTLILWWKWGSCLEPGLALTKAQRSTTRPAGQAQKALLFCRPYSKGKVILWQKK